MFVMNGVKLLPNIVNAIHAFPLENPDYLHEKINVIVDDHLTITSSCCWLWSLILIMSDKLSGA